MVIKETIVLSAFDAKVAPIMNATQLLANLHITGALFDIDDTFLRTHRMFKVAHMSLKTRLSQKYGVSIAELTAAIEEIQKTTYKLFVIDPVPGVNHTFTQLFNQYGFDHADLAACVDEVLAVQNQVPEIISGSLEFLQELSTTGIPIGAVTHASAEWTMLKLQATGLLPYFDHIEIVPVTRQKDQCDWERALEILRLFPERTLGAGDSLIGDIIPGYNIGLGYLVWINHPDSWGLYKAGGVPEEIRPKLIEVSALAELYPQLEQREQHLRLR